MADQLQTTQASGAQTTTQNPQLSASPTTSAAPAQEVQPGTATSVLNNSPDTGIRLSPTPLSTVSLTNTQTGTTTAAAPPAHKINPVLGVFSVLLFIVAIALFWFTSRGAKNTTN